MKNGECFENVQQQQVGSNTIPYRRESFKQKELLFEFDTGFKELDENMMANQHISKNIERLIKDIDSVSVIRDSLKAGYTKKLLTINHILPEDSTVALDIQPSKTAKVSAENIDSMFASAPQKQMVQIASEAARNIENTMSDVRYYTIIINDADDFYRVHDLEWHLKFTLSFACLIFFFIGAPLGAIIGKGGLGLPAVISIILFIIYYIINTMGQKMAREGTWEVWQGMWFSSAILLPIGVFITYRAVKDTRLLEADTYKKVITSVRQFSQRLHIRRPNR